MAPAVDRQVYDDETQSSDWANDGAELPVAKRHCSEPARAGFKTHSIETSLSPPPSIQHQIKCPWCAKEFDAPEDGEASEYHVLKEHMALMHPQVANMPVHDLAGKTIDSDVIADSNDGLNTLETSNVTTVTAPATGADATPENNSNAGDGDLKTDATKALHSKLHDLKRQQTHEYMEKRLLASWNLHDVREFNPDYDDTTAGLEQSWLYVFDQSKKNEGDAGTNPPRPNPYLSSTTDKGEFLKITPVEDFLDSLNDYASMPTDKLHALAANVAHTLKTWQDEWIAIEKLGKGITHKSAKKSANPRALDPPEIFQDRKEATLYGYKYDPTIHDLKKRDPKKDSMFKIQDPFVQGGFRPTAAQLRKMQAEVGRNNPNPDGFPTMIRHGQEYIPRFQEPPLLPYDGRGMTTRKRKVPHSEVAALRQTSVHDSTTPALESDIDGQPFKRLTRSIVNKVEPTHAKTAPPSPGPRARGRGGIRGGRGRGGISRTSRPALATAKVIASKAAEPLTGDSTETAPSLSVTTSQTDGLASDQNTPGSASVAPASKPALAPATPGAPPALAALPPNLTQPGEVVDASELNRRKLLAKSKNPRRTQAMLDHWARFNQEGRTRNPKRTKAQIEADKVADAERKSKEPLKAPTTKPRKRKALNTDTTDEPATKQSRTASMVGTASLQPAHIQPTLTAPTPVIPPSPASITLPQTHLMQPSAPSRPRSPQGFLASHSSAHAAMSNPQPARALQPVLPGFDRNPRSSIWDPPRRFYSFANPLPPYSSYGQTPFPPPHVNPPHRHEASPPEILPPGPTYPFDAIRPHQHLQNGRPMQRP